MLGFDFESKLITEQEPVPPPVSLALGWDGGVDVIHRTDPAFPRLIRDALEEETLAIHNGPFDLAVAAEEYPDLELLVWDALERGSIHETLVSEKLLDLADGKGLKRKYNLGAVYERRCGRTVDKTDPWRKRYGELYDVPIPRWPREALLYAAMDGIAHFEIGTKQLEYAAVFEEQEGAYPLEDLARQTRAHWALHLQSLHGFCTDQEAIEKLDRDLTRQLLEAKEKLVAAGLVRPNGQRDTKATMALMEQTCKEQGVEPIRNSRGVSLSEEALSELVLPKDHLLHVYQQYGSIMTTRSRVLDPLRRPIVRTFYNGLMENGRTSSSDPNLQNLPREGGFRECLVAAPGKTLVIADYKGAELVTWAHVLLELFGEDAPSAALANALRAGLDVHSELAATMAIEDKKQARQFAKPCNFGFSGGMGFARFRGYAKADYGLILTEAQAREFRLAWMRKWRPEAYFEYVSAHQDDSGYIDIIQFGSNRIRSRLRFAEACNTFYSGLAQDIAKDCMWRLAKEMWITPSSDLYDARQVLFAHDENVLECDVDKAEKVAARLETVMVDTMAEWCPAMRPACKVDLVISPRYIKP